MRRQSNSWLVSTWDRSWVRPTLYSLQPTPDVMAGLQPDLALVNQVIELTFDSKFKGRLF
jgi:hypothetical protein